MSIEIKQKFHLSANSLVGHEKGIQVLKKKKIQDLKKNGKCLETFN